MSEEYLLLVRLVAERIHRHLPPGVELEALVHAGVVGLLQATERCGVQKGMLLPVHLRYRIQSEIFSYLRSLDWVNHAVRMWGRKVVTVRIQLAERLSREATPEEIAAELGVSVDEYVRSHQQAGEAVFVRLEELSGVSEEERRRAQHEFFVNRLEDPLVFLRDTSIVDKLSQALGALSEQERLVISLAYYQEMTPKEIGDILGIAEDRVWRIRQQGVLRLRQLLLREGTTADRT